MQQKFSIVIPAYNEALRLPATLEGLLADLPRLKAAGLELHQVIIVDDGSQDKTAEVAGSFLGKLPVEVVSYKLNRGKGYAVRAGAVKVQSPLTLIADADMSTPWTEVIKLHSYVQKGSGLVIASRALESSQLDIRQPWYRERMGKTFNFLMRMITGLQFHDTQCGFKLMETEKFRSIWPRLKVDRFAWDIELLILAKRERTSIVEVGVVWNHMDASRVNMLKDSLEMLWSVVKIRFR